MNTHQSGFSVWEVYLDWSKSGWVIGSLRDVLSGWMGGWVGEGVGKWMDGEGR